MRTPLLMSSTERNNSWPARARSYLYAPGDRAEVLARALEGEADVVVADLEDAVPADRKAMALGNVLAALAARPSKPLHVRIAIGDPRGEDDLRALVEGDVALVRLAKVRGAADVRRATAVLDGCNAPASVALGCLIESAAGVEAALAIATAPERVRQISLGEADLRADLGVDDDRGLLYARSRVVVASRAASLGPPPQSVFVDVRDEEGLRRSCREGRALGFYGRSVIHPRQIAAVHEACEPTEHERIRARELLGSAERLATDGAFLLDDGRLVDRATVEQARALLETSR